MIKIIKSNTTVIYCDIYAPIFIIHLILMLDLRDIVLAFSTVSIHVAILASYSAELIPLLHEFYFASIFEI